MNANLKVKVIEKYHHKCFLCHKPSTKNRKLQVHHIIRRSLGGLDTTLNLVPLCEKCHKDVHESYNKELSLVYKLRKEINRVIAAKKYYSIPEINTSLNISEELISQAITDNKLKFTFADNQIKIKGSILINWILAGNAFNYKNKNHLRRRAG